MSAYVLPWMWRRSRKTKLNVLPLHRADTHQSGVVDMARREMPWSASETGRALSRRCLFDALVHSHSVIEVPMRSPALNKSISIALATILMATVPVGAGSG